MDILQHWAKLGTNQDFWFIITIMVILLVSLLFYCFGCLRKKRIIADTPTSKIRSAAQGYVELFGHGELMDGQKIISPLSKTSCVWYSIKIEKRVASSRHNSWLIIEDDTSEDYFILKDPTGECIIDPENATISCADKRIWYGRTMRPPRLGKSHKPGIFYRFFGHIGLLGSYCYVEELLYEHQPLHALGLFKTTGSVARVDLNDDVRELLSAWKKNSADLLERFDKDKDGKISMEEWEQIREAAYKEVRKQHADMQKMPAINIMGDTNDNRRPFILSSLGQEGLLLQLQQRIMAGICVTVLGTVAITIWVAMRFS